MRQHAAPMLLGAAMLALVGASALPVVAAGAQSATPEQLAKALTSQVINKALVRNYLENGGNPNVCIPQTAGNGGQTTCINLTLALIYPPTKDLALLAIQKGGLKSREEVQRGFWDAVSAKLPSVVEVLIKKRANVNEKEGGQLTPGAVAVNVAANNNDFKTVKVLTQAGADLNQVGLLGYTALASTLENGNEKMALYLVHHGASLKVKTDSGDTMLMYAVMSGSVSFVTALVALDFDVNAVDRDGFTPLTTAVSMPHIAPKIRARIIGLLLQHGANPCYRIPRNQRTPRAGMTALDIAQHADETMSIKILQPVTENCKK